MELIPCCCFFSISLGVVESLDHCDFSALRNMLIRTHMQDLIDTTDHVHFEGYRFSKLASAVNPSMQKSSTARYVQVVSSEDLSSGIENTTSICR